MSTIPDLVFFTHADNNHHKPLWPLRPRRPQLIKYTNELAAIFDPDTIMICAIYQKQTTATLKAVLAGFEKDFDTISIYPKEAKFKPSADWITNRMSVIRNILEEREESAANAPTHQPNPFNQ